ncbi:MAG: AAA family ATPase [Porphyromonas sp.]|uniref:AAA family ATPase n=1 Tax=Porphyromonas sp. TaxID=1924944 RepID=UPI002A761722|nr:AAA family ATPase [Porphyromonas sp.]MDD6927748.1 AAA family ATPase [Bacteroidales bacterium]MDY3111719.1 AAA family ATPase [Porphyromonas sp.]
MLLEDVDPVVAKSKMYVRFATNWDDYVAERFFPKRPNIYPLLVFLYKFRSFDVRPSEKDLLGLFVRDFHIPEESVLKWFSEEDFEVNFVSSCTTRRSIKSALSTPNSTITFDGTYSVKAIPSELSRAPFIQTLYAGMDSMRCLLISRVNLDELYPTEGKTSVKNGSIDTPHQTIYFGAPGSGKSYKVKEDRLKWVPEENIFRTTFHPDSDYASFVGCYKPIVRAKDDTNLSKEELLQCFETLRSETESYPVDKFAARYHASLQNISKPEKKWLREELQNTAGISFDPYAQMNTAIAVGDYLAEQGLLHSDETITYDFSPQVFTNAYVRAWEVPSEHVYLIIEEINRGNCAQIFGDLFQLLDRDRFGVSEYKIKADEDLARYLQSKLGVTHEGIKGGNLCLPSNLHIIATMNTSDQSLFPMDSAFKRRWEWEYVPINYSDSPGIPSGEFTITIGCNKYRWIDFLEKVNEQIHQVTDSEDKQMGNFFIKRSVGEDEFKSKVMFYLWHEVCKDEFHTKNNFFRSTTKEGQEFSFNDLYKDGSTDLLKGFMDSLGVTPMPLASTSAVSDATSTGTTT